MCLHKRTKVTIPQDSTNHHMRASMIMEMPLEMPSYTRENNGWRPAKTTIII